MSVPGCHWQGCPSFEVLEHRQFFMFQIIKSIQTITKLKFHQVNFHFFNISNLIQNNESRGAQQFLVGAESLNQF